MAFLFTLPIVQFGLFLLLSTSALATPITFSASGALSSDIQSTVDAFRTAIGGVNNGNVAGPLATGRREINWDGGGATDGSVAVTPFTVFQNTRGATFTTPGSGLTQTPITGGTVDIAPLISGSQTSLAGINPTYATTFSTFSPNRLFTPLDSNITNGTFSVPGTNGAATAGVSAFGAVFTNVTLANTTSIQYFAPGGASLGNFFVPTSSQGGLSFFGVLFNGGEIVSSIRITTGNTILGPSDTAGANVVVMDDFIYGEPKATPESSTFGLILLGLGGLALYRRYTSQGTAVPTA